MWRTIILLWLAKRNSEHRDAGLVGEAAESFLASFDCQMASFLGATYIDSYNLNSALHIFECYPGLDFFSDSAL